MHEISCKFLSRGARTQASELLCKDIGRCLNADISLFSLIM